MRTHGYHGTCSKYRNSIESIGLDPDKCRYRSDHWLGQGVYFFDDYEKALWWANTVSHHNDNCGSVIFQSIIESDDKFVLNLNDSHQLDRFITEIMHFVNDIDKYCVGNMPVFDYNKFRAVLFDYYKEQNNISVIIGTFVKDFAGYTQHRNTNEKKEQKKILNAIGVRFYETQICVSKKECIKSTKLVYNETEEVI